MHGARQGEEQGRKFCEYTRSNIWEKKRLRRCMHSAKTELEWLCSWAAWSQHAYKVWDLQSYESMPKAGQEPLTRTMVLHGSRTCQHNKQTAP